MCTGSLKAGQGCCYNTTLSVLCCRRVNSTYTWPRSTGCLAHPTIPRLLHESKCWLCSAPRPDSLLTGSHSPLQVAALHRNPPIRFPSAAAFLQQPIFPTHTHTLARNNNNNNNNNPALLSEKLRLAPTQQPASGARSQARSREELLRSVGTFPNTRNYER